MNHKTTGYPKPRCPRCRQLRERNLGYDLVEVRRADKYVVVHCQFCHYTWRSTNEAARHGVLRTQ